MLLVTQALSKRVQTSDGELTILDGVSLEIAAEERVAIVGASGSGNQPCSVCLPG